MILGVIEIRGVIEIKERGLSVELGKKLTDRCHKNNRSLLFFVNSNSERISVNKEPWA